jgi:glycerophosphoryl diester phosphodiesterase
VIASGREGLRRVGHKGADAIVPGNTIASFEHAAGIGVEMIEFDVLRTPEGDPAIPAAERAPLVIAHDWHDAATREPHTLAEALEAFTRPPLDRVEIDCDLKLPGREDELVAALREHGLVERAMVSTMYVESLAAIRDLEPTLRRGWTYPKVTRPWDRKPLAKPAVLAALALMRLRLPRIVGRGAAAVDASAVWVFHPIVTRALARRTRELGIELIAWTVDEPERIAQLREIGVDGICSNDPRLLATGPQDGYPAVPHGFR